MEGFSLTVRPALRPSTDPQRTTVQIRSRRTLITGATLMAGLLLIAVTLTTRADATPASSRSAASFQGVRDGLRDTDNPLYGRFFQTSPWGGPYLTASGRGAFQFFEGSWGVGALYQSPTGWPTPVYGRILEAWAAQGYEQGSWGYPDNWAYETNTNTDTCPVLGSLYQRFVPELRTGYEHWDVCAEPNGPVTSHHLPW
jgi:hypothetical protein